MRTALFIALLAPMGASHNVDTLMITSDVSESTVLHAVGEYNYDGEAHGYPRYTCTERCIRNKILYRGSTGLWSITGSGQNVELNKGTIISNSKSSDTPVGLTFRYYSNGVWKQDKSFKVLDVTPVAVSAAKVESPKQPKAGAAAATTTLPTVEKQPTNPPSRVQRKMDKKLNVIAKASATEAEEAASKAATATTATTADSSSVEAAAASGIGNGSGLGSRSMWRRSAGMLAASSATWFLGVPTFKVALKALSVHRDFRDQTALQAHEAYYQAAAPFQFINVQGGGGSSSSTGGGGGFSDEPFLTTVMPDSA